MKLPPNTRLHKGFIEFRKQYRGQLINRAWPEAEYEKAVGEIYDLLHKMTLKDDLVLEREHRLLVEDACDVYAKLHGPSLKGGINTLCNSSYYRLQNRLKHFKAAWSGRFLDTLTKYDVRDALSPFTNAGTVMRYLGTITHMFRSFEEWNTEGVLETAVKLPPFNPGTKWRKEMKSANKKELPRTRVLSPEEWNQFKAHLTPRCRQICEIALRRFLRLADIQQISHLSIKGDIIEGIQAKTGECFSIPTLAGQPVRYDFTNFRKEFKTAQIASKMDYPANHPMHFTPRDLRRTGATWAYQKTKDLVTISKMLGHTKITTTIRYLNIDEADKRSVADAIDAMASSPNLGENLGETPSPKEKGFSNLV